MRKLAISLCAALALIAAARAETAEPAASPPSNWVLASDQTYTLLLANWSSAEITFIYRICQSEGPSTRVSTTAISGQPVLLAKDQCVDVATQGSVRLTRADATGEGSASGTYQFIHAARSKSF